MVSSVCHYDRPDYLITMTTTPYLHDTISNLLSAQRPNDHHYNVAIVLYLMCLQVCDELFKQHVVSVVFVNTCVIELQT